MSKNRKYDYRITKGNGIPANLCGALRTATKMTTNEEKTTYDDECGYIWI
jgi:hypothetical protein